MPQCKTYFTAMSTRVALGSAAFGVPTAQTASMAMAHREVQVTYAGQEKMPELGKMPRHGRPSMVMEPTQGVCIQVRPGIYVTYNGDNFDWPFIEARAKHHGLSVFESLGFRAAHSGEFVSKNAVHMDCLCWVNRDSYLPQGSRGLKVCLPHLLPASPSKYHCKCKVCVPYREGPSHLRLTVNTHFAEGVNHPVYPIIL